MPFTPSDVLEGGRSLACFVRVEYQWIDSTLQPTRSGDSAVRGSLYFGRVVAPFHAAGVDASCISRSRAPTSRMQNLQCSFYQGAALRVEAERADRQVGSSEVSFPSVPALLLDHSRRCHGGIVGGF